MKLIYRGTTFDYNPSQTPGRSFQQVREPGPAYTLTYRGVPYRVNPNAKLSQAPARPATDKLIYRGMTYWVNCKEQGEVTATTAPETSTKCTRVKPICPVIQ